MILCISFEWHCAKFLLMLNVWWVISVLKLLKDFPNIVCNKWCSLSTLKWKIVLTSLLSLFMLLMCYAQLAHKLLYLRILPGKMDLDQQHLYYTFLPLNRTCVSCCIPKTKGITPLQQLCQINTWAIKLWVVRATLPFVVHELCFAFSWTSLYKKPELFD